MSHFHLHTNPMRGRSYYLHFMGEDNDKVLMTVKNHIATQVNYESSIAIESNVHIES